tara:strand:- start:57 stop:374 length:318 start_codon:yes stop_codon:yes gene_type:complete
MGKLIGGIMPELNQYEFSIEIDEYIFERFVQNKVRDEYKDFLTYKKKYPNTKCNFILRDKSETTNMEDKIYLWDISERNSLGETINEDMLEKFHGKFQATKWWKM